MNRNQRRFFLFVLLAVFAFLAVGSVFFESSITDEIEHIASGYFYLKTGVSPFNISQPPLIKIIAGLPLLLFPFNTAYLVPRNFDIPIGVVYGFNFIYDTGNDPDAILLLSRMAVFSFNVILLFLVYRLIRKLAGSRPALFALLLLITSTTLFAHLRYVTMDVPVSLLMFIGLLLSAFYIRNGNLKALCGAVLIILAALHTKFSALVILPLLILTSTFFWFTGRRSRDIHGPELFKRTALIIFLSASAFLLTYSLISTRKISVPRPQNQTAQVNQPRRPLEHSSRAPAAGLGLLYSGLRMQIVRSMGSGYDNAYFAGELYRGGNFLFFPTLFLLKEQLLWLLAIFAGTASLMIRMARRYNAPLTPLHYTVCGSTFLILGYAWYAFLSPLNIGIRHLLPVYPPLIFLASLGLSRMAVFSRNSIRIIYAVLGWCSIAMVLNYPHYLSYYNPVGLGKQGYVWGIDSNFDWGQDTQRLVKWIKEKNVQVAYMDYFGRGNPFHYLPSVFVDWTGKLGMPPEGSIFIISATRLQQARGRRGYTQHGENYEWLDSYVPRETIGRTIFVYRIPVKNPPVPQDAAKK